MIRHLVFKGAGGCFEENREERTQMIFEGAFIVSLPTYSSLLLPTSPAFSDLALPLWSVQLPFPKSQITHWMSVNNVEPTEIGQQMKF